MVPSRLPRFSAELEDLLLKFDESWQEASPTKLRDFCPPEATSAFILELVCIDITRRAKAGRTISSDVYLEVLPELTDERIALDRFQAQASTLVSRVPSNGSPTCDTVHDLPSSEPGSFSAESEVNIESEYRGLTRHAAGGLGEVMIANETLLNRRVAIKTLKREWIGNARARRDFLQEAEVTGRLDHPGIVPVHSLGKVADGRPCYAMRYVEGETLADAIQRYHRDPADTSSERTVAFRTLLTRLVAVCNTVAYAHSQGVLHRDIKPQNVMIGAFGETIVLDWGLARLTNDTNQLRESHSTKSDVMATQAGDVIGTPAYMSPEQASGNIRELCTGTDVFGLGATLYAILTSEPPYCEITMAETLAHAAAADFVSPRHHCRTVPRALDAICCKAMARRPADRYLSPLDLARDIENWLAGERVAAYHEPVIDRLSRWARKHRTLVTSGAAVFLVGIVALMMGLVIVGRLNTRLTSTNDKLTNSTEILASVFAGLDPDAEENESLRVVLGKRIGAAVDQLEGENVADPLDVARLQNILGSSLLNLGHHARARALLEKAHLTRESLLGPNHLDTLKTLAMLAEVHSRAGEHDLSTRLYEKVMLVRTEILGPAHIDTLDTKNALAIVYRNHARWDQAEPLFQEVLNARSTNLPPNHPDTLTTMNDLAMLYQAQAKWERSEPLLRQVVKGRTDRYGPGHPKTLECKNNLAAFYYDQGKYAQAEQLFLELLPHKTINLGTDHLDTLKSKYNLAMLQVARGKYEQAETVLADVLRLCNERLDARHPLSLAGKSGLARIYRAQGKYAQAIRLFHEALAEQESQLPGHHQDVVMTKNALADVYRALGEYARAEALACEVIEVSSKHLGPSNPLTLICQNTYALILLDQGRYEKAESLLEAFLQLRVAKLGPGHPKTLPTMTALGTVYSLRGKKSLAEQHLKAAVDGLTSQHEPHHPDILAAQAALARHDESVRLNQQAEFLWHEVTNGWKQRSSVDLHIYASHMALRCRNLLVCGKYIEAETIARECLTRCENNLSDEWQIFFVQSLLGRALVAQKKYELAEPQLLSGFEGLQQRLTKIPADMRSGLTEAAETLVQVYENCGEPTKAASWRVTCSSMKAQDQRSAVR